MCLYEIQTNHPIVEIHVSCKNLAKLDLGSKSDSLCLFETEQNKKYIEEDRTEIVFDNSNPNYVKSFKIYDTPDSNKQIRFEIYDYDQKNRRYLEERNQIGYSLTDSRYICSHLNQPITLDLIKDNKKGKRGQITLIAHQYKQTNSNLRCIIQAINLKKIKTFAKNNPFFEVSKPLPNGQDIPIYRSEAYLKCYSCTFNEFYIPFSSLFSQSDNGQITISFYDYQQNKPPKKIGKYDSTVKNLINSKNSTFDLEGEKSSKSVGQFKFTKLEVIKIPTFQDYLKSGIKLKLITAIDFTSSNRQLHNLLSDPKLKNLYQQCIASVVPPLTKYVNNQKIPVYGFGAKFDNQDTYVFPLTFDISHPEVNGLQGILDAYIKTIQKVELWHPNKIAPIINEAAEIAKRDFEENHNYTVLLILTDILFEDTGDAIDAVVEASEAPISIIIVSIWNQNETNVRRLQSCRGPLASSTGKNMKRDVVQFVSYYHSRDYTEQRLEMELMREIPKQLHQYCEQHGIVPEMTQKEDYL